MIFITLLRILLVAVIFALIASVGMQLESSMAQILVILASGVSGAAVSALYELIDTHGQGIKMWYLSQIKKRNDSIRLSFSYLYRIEVNGKYLMVRGKRLENQYQPVGGVYKYYDEAKDFLNLIRCNADVEMGNIDETDELRIKIKGRYLLSFIDWFQEMRNREYDPRREFDEELIEPGLLAAEMFKTLKYRKIYVHNKGLTFSDYFQCYEWIYADIFELKLDTKQKEAILEAVKDNPDKLCLVTEDEIRKMRCKNSVERNLGTNASWILGE